MDFDTLDSKIRLKLITATPVLLIALALPILGWNGFLQYEQNGATWFARSGSLMVILAVWLEFKLFAVSSLFSHVSEGGGTWGEMIDGDILKAKYRKIVTVFKYFAAALAIIGTIIWGYGDIFWELSR